LGSFDRTLTGVYKLVRKKTINVFPNPAFDKITVSSDKDIQLVCIYDVIGNLKYRENYLSSETTIDIQKLNLSDGIYMVEVLNWEDERSIQKIIVQ
jgi:hypothetical protein